MRALLQKLLTRPQELVHACIAAEVVFVLNTHRG